MNTTFNWYQELIKPDWAPPAFLFGPVWSVLYLLIAISFGYIFYKIYKNEIPKYIAIPFVLNLFLNLIFSPIQFGLQNLTLASINIILVLITLIWFQISIFKYAKWVSFINIPYLLWVSFATVLQLTITFLN